MASNNSTAKTHVSLRLPTYLLESIDAHAERESISRTEAFVHYLQTGLEISDEKANEPSADEAMLMNIQAELAEIKAMLKAGGASVPAGFDASSAVAGTVVEDVEEDVMVPVSFISEEEDEAEEVASEFTTSDAVYTGVVEEVEDKEEDEAEVESDANFSEGAEDETASMFSGSDAVASPDEMPVGVAAPVSNVFSPNYQPAAAEVEEAEIEEVSDEGDSMETLSDYYNETAAEAEEEADFDEGAEDEVASMFSGSDAVASPDEMPVEEDEEDEVIESNPYVSSSYFSAADEDEDEAEEEADMFDDSDAVFEDASEDEDDYSDDDEEDDIEDEIDMFDASDEVIDPEDMDDEDEDEGDEDAFEKSSYEDDEDEFDDSDAVEVDSYSHEEAADLDLSVGSAVVEDSEDELDIDEVVYVEPLALSDLEDAVSLVAQQFPMIEKVWLFGNAATGGAIEQDTIDLCVKADKFKSKYADLFISMIEDNTGKTANVVLRNDMEKSVKQIWKATRIDLYRA